MGLQITDTDGNRVYIAGWVELEEQDGQMIVKGFDIGNDDEITHEVDAGLMQNIPGTGAGKLLMYIYKKAKELLCPNCNPTNPE